MIHTRPKLNWKKKMLFELHIHFCWRVDCWSCGKTTAATRIDLQYCSSSSCNNHQKEWCSITANDMPSDAIQSSLNHLDSIQLDLTIGSITMAIVAAYVVKISLHHSFASLSNFHHVISIFMFTAWHHVADTATVAACCSLTHLLRSNWNRHDLEKVSVSNKTKT